MSHYVAGSFWKRVIPVALGVLAGLVATAGTLAVAVAGFTLSYDAIRRVGIAAGIRPDWAWLLPVSIDGAMAVATVTAVVMNRMRRPVWYAWLVVGVGAGISIGCNALHAQMRENIRLDDYTAMAVSAIPALMLFLSIHLLVELVDAAARNIGSFPADHSPALPSVSQEGVISRSHDPVDTCDPAPEPLPVGVAEEGVGSTELPTVGVDDMPPDPWAFHSTPLPDEWSGGFFADRPERQDGSDGRWAAYDNPATPPVDTATVADLNTASNPPRRPPADVDQHRQEPAKKTARKSANGPANDTAKAVERWHAKMPAATNADLAAKAGVSVRSVERYRPDRGTATKSANQTDRDGQLAAANNGSNHA